MIFWNERKFSSCRELSSSSSTKRSLVLYFLDLISTLIYFFIQIIILIFLFLETMACYTKQNSHAWLSLDSVHAESMK